MKHVNLFLSYWQQISKPHAQSLRYILCLKDAIKEMGFPAGPLGFAGSFDGEGRWLGFWVKMIESCVREYQ